MDLINLATLVALLKNYHKELTHALTDAVELDGDVDAQKNIEAKLDVIDRALDITMEDLDVTSTLEVGNKFRYKGYACTVDDVTRKLVRFTGTRNEKVGEVTRQMILNVESFNSAVEERRIILVQPGIAGLSVGTV